MNIVLDRDDTFAILQSRVHELWALYFGSSFEDRPIYVASSCFSTFPFATENREKLQHVGNEYNSYRALLMEERGEGLTQTYNRFHNPGDHTSDINHLRELQHAMDQAVLSAYGWDDLATSAGPHFLQDIAEPEHCYQGRLFWPAPFRDEVLARLLALNAERAAAEQARGLAPAPVTAEELEDA